MRRSSFLAVDRLDLGTDIPSDAKDNVFKLQTLHTDDFTRLSVGAFYAAGIVRKTELQASKKIWDALTRLGILESGRIRTDKIDERMGREIMILTSAAQKRLISLLFFWEDETRRYQQLRELQRLYPDERNIKDQMTLMPSQRVVDEVPPPYH